MLDSRFALTGAALVIVMAASYLVARPPGAPRLASAMESVSAAAPVSEPADADKASRPEYLYLIREYDGRVAVFPAGESEPELILDVQVKYLPDLDRRQMLEGIPVKDLDELALRLEDYTS
jgi:hypothetical protein